MPSNDPGKKDLVRDEQGAVMIMGLAMILGLIAFLWYIMGIGETIAFRDHMQDAADSAAFSQMAVEAAGMNFIVLLNMIIMLLVIVYIILSIALTIYWAIMVGNLLTCPEDLVNCAAGIDQLLDYPGLYSDRGDAAKVISYVEMGLSILQSGAALIAPWVGTAAGVDASSSYKMHSQTDSPLGLSFGSNNFSPDTLAIFSSLGRKTHVDGGLPVTHEFLANDCSHLVEFTTGAIENLLGGNGGKALSILNKIAGAFAQLFQWYYCDNNGPPIPGLGSVLGKAMHFLKDLGVPFREMIGGGDEGNYWTADGYGPMTNFKHVDINPDGHVTFDTIKDSLKPTKKRHDPEAKNGADRNQAYSVLVAPGAFEDASATHNIALMQLQHMQGFTNNAEQHPSYLFYFAQAELYFDCDKGWRSPKCDDLTNNFDHEDMTMYMFGWRARLVKFHTPEGSTITKILDFVNKGLSMITDVKGWFNGGASNPFIKALKFLDQATGIDIIGFLGSLADLPPTQIFH